MQSSRTDKYEDEANVLYNTLKRCPSIHDCTAQLHDQIRVKNGKDIFESTIRLFISNLLMLQVAELTEKCDLPEDPGNQEDEATINEIMRLETIIKNKYAAQTEWIKEIINKMNVMLNGKPCQIKSVDIMSIFAYWDIINTEDRPRQYEKYLQRTDGRQTLTDVSLLMKAKRRMLRKELWDKHSLLTNHELSLLATAGQEINALLKDKYDPGFYRDPHKDRVADAGQKRQKSHGFG